MVTCFQTPNQTPNQTGNHFHLFLNHCAKRFCRLDFIVPSLPFTAPSGGTAWINMQIRIRQPVNHQRFTNNCYPIMQVLGVIIRKPQNIFCIFAPGYG